MASRKYAVEIALQLTTTHWQLLQPDGFAGAQAHSASSGAAFNVYAILERPRLELDPASLRFVGQAVEGSFKVCGPHPAVHQFRVPLAFDVKGRTVDSPYPHTCLRVLEGNQEVSYAKLPLLAPWVDTDYKHMSHYRVDYVGQAQGGIHDRDAIARLQNHETLQKIMSDIMLERPHSEAWLFLTDFEPSTMWHVGGTSAYAEVSLEESMAHVAQVEQSIVKDRSQLINLVEAGLIRYFQPAYNDRYKKTFPSPNHSTYTSAYESDINALALVLSTTAPGPIVLYSDAAEPNSVHTIRYPLHSKTLREYMLDLFGMSSD
ncbi:hypothetical protein WME90_39080 [Sorangium sp. So ce375]|uniref:hypothetical protein n=1 Tax=Sorangium sp. So ce375 TaxID=3133306 RepID=UPI003F5C66D9